MDGVLDSRLSRYLRLLLLDPAHSSVLVLLVVVGDAALTQLIIRFVSYTEIDWETYMYHIDLYLKGERDYTAITGPTGPLVYPAGHVHIHQILHLITSSGLNVARAQQLYGLLYLASLVLSCLIYKKAGGTPNWVLLILPLSKRLHSIYVLRLFNDCWATVVMQGAILAYAQHWDILGSLLLSLALSVKMSILLYLPGVLLILWKRRGLFWSIGLLMAVLAMQALLALPFLSQYHRQYFSQAFDLSRVFLYKWTVNWRFINENIFLSSYWARMLLIGHISTLTAFATMKWCRGDGGVALLLRRGLSQPTKGASTRLSADYIITILTTTNLIGILFARSLHYQFYSWYAQQIPFLAWRTRLPDYAKLALIASIEYSWNVFPSTRFSSALLLFANASLLLGVWYGWSEGLDVSPDDSKKSE